MLKMDADHQSDAYARIFRLLSVAKDEAKALKLPHLAHLTDMALLQLVLDWEGVDLETAPDHILQTLVGQKAKLANATVSAKIKILHPAPEARAESKEGTG